MKGALSPFRSKRTRRAVFSVLGFAGVAIYLFPIYWMLISGFKSSAEIFANPPTFFPRAPNLDAFHSVFVQENIARYLRNSVIIAVPVALLSLALGSMGAYAMSRIRSRACIASAEGMRPFPSCKPSGTRSRRSRTFTW